MGIALMRKHDPARGKPGEALYSTAIVREATGTVCDALSEKKPDAVASTRQHDI
jgi:hypothetical protein